MAFLETVAASGCEVYENNGIQPELMQGTGPIRTPHRGTGTGASENNPAKAHCGKMNRTVRTRAAGGFSGTGHLSKDIDERQDNAIIQISITSTSVSVTHVAGFLKKIVSLSGRSVLTVSAGKPPSRWLQTRH